MPSSDTEGEFASSATMNGFSVVSRLPTSNGTELFFVSGDNMMAVKVSTRGLFQPGTAKALFSTSAVRTGGLANYYDVSADGQRFVVVQQAGAGEPPKLTVVENWIRQFPDQK